MYWCATDALRQSVILNQVENGIVVRMAVLEKVLAGGKNAQTAH